MPKWFDDEVHRPRDGDDFDHCPSRWVEPHWNPKFDGRIELAEPAREREVSPRPWVMLLDGGDLRDVTRMLRSYGVSLAINTQGAVHRDEVPSRLLVASAERALRFDRAVLDKRDRVVTVAVASEPDPGLARQLARAGFDYVIERPVDSDALRHLLHSALYRGSCTSTNRSKLPNSSAMRITTRLPPSSSLCRTTIHGQLRPSILRRS